MFIPDIDKWEKWDKNLIELVQEFDYLLLDATFYDSKEINRDISEIPHPLVSETISLLDNLTTEDKSKVYFIHMNHTNIMLDPNSELSEYVPTKDLILQDLAKDLFINLLVILQLFLAPHQELLVSFHPTILQFLGQCSLFL